MSDPRSYGDPCGIARALDAIGERWALLIVRELLFGPKRFTDLKTGLSGASPNVLSQRLKDLEAAGVLQRRNAGGAIYELTPWGAGLHPLLLQLGRWGAKSQQRPTGPLSIDALMVALEATFVAERAGDLDKTYEFHLGDERFSAVVKQGQLTITRGTARAPDAVIVTDPATLRAVAFGDQKLADAAVTLRGDARVGRAFFRLFARPSQSA